MIRSDGYIVGMWEFGPSDAPLPLELQQRDHVSCGKQVPMIC